MEILAKTAAFVKRHREEATLAVFVALISLLSFAMGYLTAVEHLKEPVEIL